MFDFPSPPTTGQVVTAANGAAWRWDGVKWVAAIAGGASLTISDTPPASPSVGAMWFDSVGAQTYLWYNDGTSSQWTPVNAPPSSSVAYLPTSGGNMTGPLVLAADPTTSTQAATANYVDARASQNVGRNYIQNAQFNIWQRGGGAFTGAVYNADRWVVWVSGDTCSVSRGAMSDASRATLGDESATSYLGITVTGTTGSSSITQLYQRTEGVRRLAGKTVTVSFYVTASAAGLQAAAYLSQGFGTGGSPSAVVNTTPQTVTFTTNWVRYSLTFSLPSVAGKTFGTNGDDSTTLVFNLSSGGSGQGVGVQSGTFWFYGIQLEVGSGAGFPTQLAKRSPGDDLADCQRFFFGFSGYISALGAAAWGYAHPIAFPVTMRASPTFTISTTGSPTAVSSIGAGGNSQIFTIQVTPSGSGNVSFATNYNGTASADL